MLEQCNTKVWFWSCDRDASVSSFRCSGLVNKSPSCRPTCVRWDGLSSVGPRVIFQSFGLGSLSGESGILAIL